MEEQIKENVTESESRWENEDAEVEAGDGRSKTVDDMLQSD